MRSLGCIGLLEQASDAWHIGLSDMLLCKYVLNKDYKGILLLVSQNDIMLRVSVLSLALGFGIPV